MARKIDETEIDGIKLRSTQLAPRKAAQLASRLLKYLAPVLGSMGPTDEVNLKTLSGALRTMMEDMSEEDLDTVLCRSLAGCVAIRNNEKGEPEKFELFDPNNIDLAFAGKLPTMFKAVQWALGVNYADFFDESAPATTAVAKAP